ncbi:GPI-linked NAD(P)(+)--arginine ADP-ribosyltransferase 1-like isoform X1 [Varanus komodoensis]|uniref:GPI-linked NAD(P)(+)--arginine ADP-ribosyltransferase 1-like isoform X1 n=2 Tax=Varanus komodoensis TaxID=61221 RepID=UPI001CF7C13D|nr:GPI-linked NAD(P)(+)--arginine ADP-ribosyltransferase 1-like isoform X1 [Varanus komodoensis]XP_044288105.1 GPI-linked NAD(P)(+)--arginine ADP-ribosyltransferase 1-like isoform X1 [Varanus komodoensis]
MRTWSLRIVLALPWMGLFTGGCQVSCFENVLLDMSLEAFDDQYKDCDAKVKANWEAPTPLNFTASKDFESTWQRATSEWEERKASLRDLPSGFQAEHGTAVLAYTSRGSLYRDFNAATRAAGKSSEDYQKHFPFKRFHFLLTRAVQILGAQGSDCYTTYRGTENVHFQGADAKKQVRFGQFASSSLKEGVAQTFGKATFFTIRTCFGVRIRDLSFYLGEDEVLIPPYERFRVVRAKQENDKISIELESDGSYSSFNCGRKNAAGPSQSSSSPASLLLLCGLLLTAGLSPDTL